MFLHLAIPAFHAAVHQAAVPALRGQPVAVAIDAGPQAPLISVSREAQQHGITVGMRAHTAKALDRHLTVVTPEPAWYHRAQQAIVDHCGAISPLVGGTNGNWDIDLAGTERLWYDDQLPADPLQQAAHIAQHLRTRIAKHLHLNLDIGVANDVRTARLAARTAHQERNGVVSVSAADRADFIDSITLTWCDELAADHRQQFIDCGLTTIGHVRALNDEQMRLVLGDDYDTLLALMHDTHPLIVPALTDPEPSFHAGRHAGDAGVDHQQAERLIARCARELGFTLRQHDVAATTVTFHGRYVDGRVIQRQLHHDQQIRHDDVIARLGCELLHKGRRRQHWDSIALTVSGLRSAEEQLVIFDLDRPQRVERAQDDLRRRFQHELVLPLAHAC